MCGIALTLGVSEAIEELEADLKSYSINTLWRDGKVMCYPSSNVLLSFAEKFHDMRNANSNIFSKIWTETLQHACKSDISIRDVEARVWNPTLTKCHEILDKLHDRSMLLADVDKQFVQYDREKLEMELKMLFRGVSCGAGDSRDYSWIYGVVKQIESYRHLCTYCEAANILLKFKETLQLKKGDFKNV